MFTVENWKTEMQLCENNKKKNHKGKNPLALKSTFHVIDANLSAHEEFSLYFPNIL